MSVRAVIFDVGGTLVKTDEAIVEAIAKALAENDLELADRQVVFNAFGKNSYTNVRAAVQSACESSDIEKKTEDCFRSFEGIFPGSVLSSLNALPDVAEVLETLKQKAYKLGVVTGFTKKEAIAVLQQTKLIEFFEVIVTSDAVSEKRPHPDGLVQAAKGLGVALSECLYVGDTVADIQMAKNAKVPIACVKTGVQNNELLANEDPEHFLDNMSELLNFVEISHCVA